MKNLTKTLLLAILILCASPLNAQEIALQLYSLRNEMKQDAKGTHALIPGMGIKYLEGGGTYGMEKEEYKAFLSGLGLSIVAVGAGYEALRDDPQSDH
jgi:hypothetical protein